jgi:hypothetical protein
MISYNPNVDGCFGEKRDCLGLVGNVPKQQYEHFVEELEKIVSQSG